MMTAIMSALAVLSYFELSEEDQPPAHMWHHQERLDEWFAAVKQRWKHPEWRDQEETDSPSWAANEFADVYR